MTRSRVVAVASAKGSPGVTFVAAGLACRLAALGLDVLAVDADGEDHALAAALGTDAGDAGEALARAASLGVVTPAGLRSVAPTVGTRLALVDAPAVDAIDGRTLVGAARGAGFGAVVVDLGHLVGRLQRQLVAASDWLVWVVMADPLGLQRADHLIGRSDLTAASAGLVFNRLGPGAVKGADRVLSERHRLPVMARLRDDRRAARDLSVRRPAHSRRSFAAAFDDLARTLHPDLAGRSRRVWP